MKWRWWRTPGEMAADFACNRSPEDQATFVLDCDLPKTQLAERVAFAVRRSVADYGMIETEFIRADDRYPDQLVKLSGWDSLDFVGWTFELERELGIHVTDDVFKNIRQPFSVADLTHAVYAFLEQHDDSQF